MEVMSWILLRLLMIFAPGNGARLFWRPTTQIFPRANTSANTTQYIREHHLSENSFYYWQRLFRKEAVAEKTDLPSVSSSLTAAFEKTAATGLQNSSFIEVSVPSVPASSTDREPSGSNADSVPSWDMLLQHGGYSLYLNNSVSEKGLNTVLRAISHA